MIDAAPLTPARQQLVLAICCLSLLIVGIDISIVNIALPAIRTDLHTATSGLQWITDAYTIVLASLLMFSGSLADRVGRRRIFLIGLALFVLGSLLCGLAPNVPTLIASRALQGVGGSMLNPVALSIITNTITKPAERARAIGLWGAVTGVSLALGPLIGGGLIAGFGWRAVFYVNVPIGLIAMVLAGRFIPESRAPHARRFDPPGQILVIALLATTVFGIIEGPTHGWGSATITGAFAAAAAFLIALILIEGHRVEPLLELRIFRSIPFTGAAIAAVAVFVLLNGLLFLSTLYLQDVRGFSALHAGLLTLPLAFSSAVCPPLAGRITATRGPRIPLVVAGVAATIGAGLLLDLHADTTVWLLGTAYFFVGIGSGMANAPITNTAVSGMPRSQAGMAAAVASTSRQVGATLGVAVIGSILPTTVGAGIGSHVFISDAHIAALVLASCGLVLIAVGIISTSAVAAHSSARALGSPQASAQHLSHAGNVRL